MRVVGTAALGELLPTGMSALPGRRSLAIDVLRPEGRLKAALRGCGPSVEQGREIG